MVLLFLFQLLKYFKGAQEIIGTVFIPNGAGVLLALLPLLGYGRFRKFGHIFGVLVVSGLLNRRGNADLLCARRGPCRHRESPRVSRRHGEGGCAGPPGAVTLARRVSCEGAINLLRRDPQTQGPILFDQNCAVCHSYKGVTHPQKEFKASDLNGFGSEEWVTAF